MKVTLSPGHVKVEGPKGQLERTLPHGDVWRYEPNEILRVATGRPEHFDDAVGRRRNQRQSIGEAAVEHRLERILELAYLELAGFGYRVAKQGEELVLNLGYSHPIRFKPPQGISIEVQDPTKFSVNGTSIEDVGQVAANIRGFRPPEPYKGKGVRYRDEKVRRKAGKAGKGAKATA